VFVVTRHRTSPATVAEVFAAIETLVELLPAAPGFLSLEVGRSPDDTELLAVVSSWEDAGSARRGLTSTEVRMQCWALYACAIDEPTSFESVVRVTPDAVVRGASDLAADSLAVRLGEAAGPDVPRSNW
jgi:quinol monooxygenase YgiN